MRIIRSSKTENPLMSEKYVHANGIRLAYEEFGDPSHPAIVLMMGLGTQLIGWPVAMCEGLVDRGFRVIRFDNRDIGLSEKMENAHIPQAATLMLRSKLRLPLDVPYTLTDMAKDVVGLLDALHIDRAHLVGASMGGMIGQIVAAKFGERLLSFTSIMSTSGSPKIPMARPEVVISMAKRSLGIEKITLESTMAYWRKIGSPGYQPTDEELKKKILDSYYRSNYPQGYARHMAAVLASGSRVRLLKQITTPTLVIHGRDDALVSVEGGIDTARHIPGAKLEIFDGMGHDLPKALLPDFIELIAHHARESQEKDSHAA
jgi:pimeloyl-ACP methyl ester carboxylesterase